MNNNFDKILHYVLLHEGGFVNHPRDPGGMTNLGVTKRVWEAWVKRDVDAQEMQNLTPDMVAPLYRSEYWNPIRGDNLPPGVNYCVFDCAVNSGVRQASRFLQRVVGVPVDGSIGPVTVGATFKADRVALIRSYNDMRLKFLQALPTWSFFGRGWSNRVHDVTTKAIELAARKDK